MTYHAAKALRSIRPEHGNPHFEHCYAAWRRHVETTVRSMAHLDGFDAGAFIAECEA